MTRILIAALAAFLLAILSGPAVAETKAALLTRVQGAVQILRSGGASEKAAPMAVLYVGDRLDVPAGGRVGVVVYSDGHRETADGKCTLSVTAAGLQGGTVQRTAASRALAGLQSHAPTGGARAAVTTRPKELDLPLREVQLATDNFVRRSSPVIGLPRLAGEGTLYSIVIRGSQGEVHREMLTDSTKTWTPQVTLAPGDYEIRLEEENKNILARRTFTVLAPDAEVDRLLKELALFKSDDADPDIFIAASVFLDEKGLTESALEAAQVGLCKQPSPELLRWTGDLAEKLGRLTEAAAWDHLAKVMEESAKR